jgi:hypothetical protein
MAPAALFVDAACARRRHDLDAFRRRRDVEFEHARLHGWDPLIVRSLQDFGFAWSLPKPVRPDPDDEVLKARV